MRLQITLGICALTVAFIFGCIVAPERPTCRELGEINRQLSIENLRLRAELSTYKEEQ